MLAILKRILITILALFWLFPLIAQFEQIGSDTINSYFPVESVTADYVQCPASTDLSGLQPGDKVILIQMTGIVVPDSDPSFVTENNMGISLPGNAGYYEMLAVASVDDGADRVGFTVTLNASNFSNGEKIQLVKIYEADYATVTSELSVDEWDGATGGILAMVIFKKLVLEADINVSGKGFRGGVVEPDYSYGCIPVLGPTLDTFYFHQDKLNRAGNKGESNVEVAFEHTKGSGRIVNGGGGGLGKFAGGGGGANNGKGGPGGQQGGGCSVALYASGGLKLENLYENGRLSFGGGGGSSTEDVSNAATPGGNGGGIVIILADTLDANNNSIVANGDSVKIEAAAGGGGGGAGGAVLLDINVYEDNVLASVAGGKGGDSQSGAGGGGGGGIVMYANTSKPDNVTVNYSGGAGGSGPDNPHDGDDGDDGGELANLALPLNGFLFNTLIGIDTVCEGNAPDSIIGSMPKGGEAGYTYNWLQRTEMGSWEAAAGTGDSLVFYPDELTETTYFTREVISGDVKDTALEIKVFVYPAISGNELNIRDTLCYSSNTGNLSIEPLTGGNGIYEYMWESYTDAEPAWDSIAGTDTLYSADIFVTTYYRRIVNAAVCVDTSNTDTLTVFQLINNNNFPLSYCDTAICEGQEAGVVRLDYPSGGEEGSYLIQWLESIDGGNYTDIPGASSQNYEPGTPDTSYFYRRVAISGSDSACIDTSNSFHIVVFDVIDNNLIQTDSSRYCWGDVPELILGQQPIGGDYNDYDYRWFTRFPGGSWNLIPGESGMSYLPTTNYEDTVQLVRVVESGNYSACIDSSNIILIDVIPEIVNVLDSDPENICENQIPLPFTEVAATGGSGVIDYLWQYQLTSGGSWLLADIPNDNTSYNSAALDESTNFRRAAISEICTTHSNIINITVYPFIENNEIIGAPIQYACDNSNYLLSAEGITGGKAGETPRYLWEQTVTLGSWIEAAGTSTTEDFTSDPISDSLYYHRIVYSGEDDQCIDTSNVVLVRINTLPTGDIISGIDTACNSKTIPVQFNNLTGSSPWTLVIGTSAGDAFSTSGITATTGQVNYPAINSGLVKVLDIIDDSACHADLTLMSENIDLKVYEYPTVNPGSNDQVCGTQYQLQASINGNMGYWLSEQYEFSDTLDPNATVTVDDFSENIYHTFIWTDKIWECEVSDEVEILFHEQPEKPDLGDDVVLDNVFNYQMEASEPIGQGEWTVTGPGSVKFSDGDSTRHNTQLEFQYPLTGNYLFIWTVENGVCKVVSDSLLVTIGGVELFDGFSPNGDGINDYYIVNLTGDISATLTLLDRWGNIVNSFTDSEQITWDGTNINGDKLPEGAYIYILEQAGIKAKKGFIELRR